MKPNKRIAGKIILSAPVNTKFTEATVTDSAHGASRQALTQLGKALCAYGPFVLGPDISFVQAGIKLDVIDTSKKENANFDQASFEAFVQRAHDICSDALLATGDTSAQLAAAAEAFASQENRNADAIKALFNSVATQRGASLISKEGELIEIGVGSHAVAEDGADLEIDVACIRRFLRVKTATNGKFDVPAELADGVQIGQHIRFDGVEPPAGATCIRGESIDTDADPTGELFEDSAVAQSASHPDNAK
ncbi:MAG: hypothetical protein EPN38_07315 [Rhodanobacteraceae bacterium]|nr:MAG: hypothetical protein EPN38_07315 [Rhodanobacteraceae bacterium]